MALRLFLLFLCLHSLAAHVNPRTAKEHVVRYKRRFDNVKYLFELRRGASVKLAIFWRPTRSTVLACVCRSREIRFADTKEQPRRGPFYIDGAEPGNASSFHLLDLHVGWQTGRRYVDRLRAAKLHALHADYCTNPLTGKMWFYPIDGEKTPQHFRRSIDLQSKFPLHPFLAASVVAPANGEARSSIAAQHVAATWTRRKSAKAISLYLPVNVAGALFYFWRRSRCDGYGKCRQRRGSADAR